MNNQPDKFDNQPVSVKLKISALWTATLFVFAYVDIFSLYRPDFRQDIEAGEISGFQIGETFLLLTTAYIAVPSLMVFLSLVLKPALSRTTNIVLSALYALTIIGGAVGEWNYYIFGSAIEVALLGGVIYYAWTWPRGASATTAAPNTSAA